MMRALYTAATGMAAQQRNIDTTANNLANVNTTGYKKSKVHFQDLLYHNERTAGVPSSFRPRSRLVCMWVTVSNSSARKKSTPRGIWKTQAMI